MDEKRYKVDFAFLEKEVLAVLLFGSGAKGQLTSRSDRDFCIVIPGLQEIGEKRLLLKKKKIYVNLDVVGKRYDIWLFEELPLYMKLQVIENHKVVFCSDLPTLYEYFYFYRKIWDDQKHRQEMDKEELFYHLLKG